MCLLRNKKSMPAYSDFTIFPCPISFFLNFAMQMFLNSVAQMSVGCSWGPSVCCCKISFLYDVNTGTWEGKVDILYTKLHYSPQDIADEVGEPVSVVEDIIKKLQDGWPGWLIFLNWQEKYRNPYLRDEIDQYARQIYGREKCSFLHLFSSEPKNASQHRNRKYTLYEHVQDAILLTLQASSTKCSTRP